MTADEIQEFRKQFKSIVYIKGQLIVKQQYIAQLHQWDRNDSHKKAILKALDERDTLDRSLIESLKGKSYEQWKLFSKQLSTIICNNEKTKRKIEAYQIKVLSTENTIKHMQF